MASRLNILNILRGIKNLITSSTAERVMLELDYDKGSCRRQSAIVETVSLASLVSGTVALTTQLPANSIVRFAGIYNESAVTLLTATNAISLGKIGTIGAYYTSSSVGTSIASGFNEIVPVVDANARPGTAASTVLLAISNTSGASAGTNNTGTGTVKAVVLFDYAQAIQA